MISNEPTPKVIELPAVRDGSWCAVLVECQPIGATMLCSVTWRNETDAPASRRWFPEEAAALAFAVEKADIADLPLIDLRDVGEFDQ